jgi:hypothetical protein
MVNRSELAKELKRKHPELEEKKIEKIETKKFDFGKKIPSLVRPAFTRGDKELDNEL